MNVDSPALEYARPMRRPPRITWREARPVLVLAAVLVAAELACARLAFHTIGEIESALLMMALVVNIVPLALLFVSRRWAVRGLLAIALCIVPYQMWLGVRWWRVHREADRILAHVQSTIAATGRPPPTLKGYTFRDAGTRPYITYGVNRPNAPRAFEVAYWVGTPTTSHWYEPGIGWMYYPD